MSFTPSCFGDFNHDGILDFAKWTGNDRLEIINLAENKFIAIKNKFVIIEEKNNNTFQINWKKSKWFKRE